MYLYCIRAFSVTLRLYFLFELFFACFERLHPRADSSSGSLQTQKWKLFRLRIQSYEWFISPPTFGVGQNIVLHLTPTVKNSAFLIIFGLPGSFNLIFSIPLRTQMTCDIHSEQYFTCDLMVFVSPCNDLSAWLIQYNTIQYNFIAKWETLKECALVRSTLTHTFTPVLKKKRKAATVKALK